MIQKDGSTYPEAREKKIKLLLHVPFLVGPIRGKKVRSQNLDCQRKEPCQKPARTVRTLNCTASTLLFYRTPSLSLKPSKMYHLTRSPYFSAHDQERTVKRSGLDLVAPSCIGILLCMLYKTKLGSVDGHVFYSNNNSSPTNTPQNIKHTAPE